MRYEMMLPYQIRKAIDDNTPVVLPLGVLEFHSEHMAVGVDTLVVIKALELLEKEADLIILPPFYYGAGSYVVEPAKGNGTVHVGPDALKPFALDLFRSLLRIGFKNIHAVIHHQSENFTAGMPTDLAFKLAGRQAIFEMLEVERGDGWWGDNSMESYYDAHAEGDNPFNYIQIHPLMNEHIINNYLFDHAGEGETSLMMSLCPEGVDMDKHSDEKWYARAAKKATSEYGDTARDMILEHLKSVLL